MDGSDRFIEPKTAGVGVGCSYRPSIDNLAEFFGGLGLGLALGFMFMVRIRVRVRNMVKIKVRVSSSICHIAGLQVWSAVCISSMANSLTLT